MQKIIEVDKGDFRAFVYEGDAAALARPDWRTLPSAPLNASEFVASWRPAQDIGLLLVAWLLDCGTQIAFFDVGSNVGTDAIRVAKLSKLLGRCFPIVAFEPGESANLLPYTIKLNELDDLVVFEELCVSDSGKPTVLFGESGVSLNNRIVNRRPESEGFCKIVHSTTVTAYMHRPALAGRHLVAKIDTQGAEWLVWQGLKQVAAHATLLMEFTPWALEPFVSPTRFLDELTGPYRLFDLGYARDRFVPVADFGEFLARVQRPPHHWTDILCLPRGLPSGDAMIARLRSAFT